MKDIGILGGGIGGLSLAIALEKFKIPYELFEQKSTIQDANLGMILWPNALKVLNKLGLSEELKNLTIPINKYFLKNPDGSSIQDFDLANYKYGVHSISKSDYINLLLSGINKQNLKTNTPYYSYKASWGKPVKVDFHQGDELEFDYLFGADGPMSPIRLKLIKDGKPEYAGYTVWRGFSTYIPSFMSDNNDIHDFIDPLRRFIVQPAKDGIFWWAVSFESNKFLHQSGNRRKKMNNYFKDWDPEIMEMILNTEEEEIVKAGAFLRNPNLDFKPERVLLSGDANMMFSPILGKGACQSIEESFYLAESISKNGLNQSTIRDFCEYRKNRNIEIAEFTNKFANAAKSNTLVGLLFGKSRLINNVRRSLTLSSISE